MPDPKPNVVLTNVNVDSFSRHDLLEWVNSTVHGKYTKIEDLASGAAYCQMMELLYPNCIGMKKVKMDAKLELECLHNLKLLQSAFTKVQFDKSVPIERLIKRRFQDNFEFLQWFKKFFDTFSGGKENLKVPAALAAAAANVPKPIRKPQTKAITPPFNEDLKKKTPRRMDSPHSDKLYEQNIVSSTSPIPQLESNLEDYYKDKEALENEIRTYSYKFKAIENILKESIERNEYVETSQHFLTVMHRDMKSATNGSNVESPNNEYYY